jgi:hypothetical protein
LYFFIDKYINTENNRKSTNAVYMKIANAEGRERIQTIMLLKDGCDEWEAFAPIRRDLQILAEGMTMYDCLSNTNSPVSGNFYNLIFKFLLYFFYSLDFFRGCGRVHIRPCPGVLSMPTPGKLCNSQLSSVLEDNKPGGRHKTQCQRSFHDSPKRAD